MRILTCLLIAGLWGCGDNYAEVKAADTVQGYEAYLQANPDSRYAQIARMRLETLLVEEAKEEQSVEKYSAFISRFPRSALIEQARTERENLMFAEARRTNTADVWQGYLDEHPKARKKQKQEAKRMLKVHEYMPNLEVSAPTITQVNLAENPEGPLDGWGFQVMVTNNGDKTIESMSMSIAYLDDEGRALDTREWPLVAPFWSTPIEEERKVPMKPGETRPWDWTTGNMPEGWSRKVRVYPSRISYVSE